MSYKEGHIYKIICKLDSSIVYIGSTFTEIRKRWYKHKNEYKIRQGSMSIHKHFDKYGIKNFKIIHIKSYTCYREHNRDCKHLHAYELLWINKTKNCVNQNIPFNPLKYEFLKENQKQWNINNKDKKKEWANKNREKINLCNKNYREKNKELIAEKKKEYREKNKELIAEKQKEYREKNKELIAEKKKEYREKNKELIAEKQKEHYQKNKEKLQKKIKCECGCEITKNNLLRHLKSKKHLKFIS
jgi:hypothetical protein